MIKNIGILSLNDIWINLHRKAGVSDTVPGPATQAVKINLIGQRAELTFKQAEQAGLHPLLHTTLQAFVQPLLPAFLPRYGKTGF